MWCMSGRVVWWSCQSPGVHSCGLLNHPNSFCGVMFKLNAKFSKDFIYLFLERREKEREKRCCERDPLIGCLSHAPQLGTWPATQPCALAGNWTRNLRVHRLAGTQSTEPHQPGQTECKIWCRFFALMSQSFWMPLPHSTQAHWTASVTLTKYSEVVIDHACAF